MDSKYVKAYVSMLNQLSEANPNIVKQSPEFGGVSMADYDDGSSSVDYNAGPLSVQQKKDPSGNMQSNRIRYNTGIDSVQVKNYASGVKKLTAQGPGEDAYVGTDASAQRLGVDPNKVNSFVNQPEPDQPQTMEEEAALEEIRRLAFGKQELDEVGAYAGDDAAYEKYADTRAKGDMLNKELTGANDSIGIKNYTDPKLTNITTDMTTGLAGKNPEMEKRYTMNKLTAPAPANPYSPDELEEMRRLAFGKEELDEAEPSDFQQAKTAVGQQYNNYKEAGAMADAAAKAGHISAADAQAAKSHLAGSMVSGGVAAAKAGMQGRNAQDAYTGSMVKSIGDTVAQSGITPQVAQQAATTAQQYRGPNAQDITKDPSFAKLPKAKQQEVMQAQQQIRNMSDDDLATVKNFDAKKAGADLQTTGQGIANSQATVKNKMANNDPNTQAGVASPSTYAAMGMEPPQTASPSATPTAPASAAPAATTPPVPNPANATPRAPAASPGPTTPEQPVAEGDYELEEMRRLAYGREELDEVGPQGYAGDDQAFAKYADNRAKGDMLAKDAADSGGVGVKSFVSPQAKAVTQDLTTGLAGNNPEMEKRYTMNKLTAPAPRDISGELEESELDAMRRIMNHRR